MNAPVSGNAKLRDKAELIRDDRPVPDGAVRTKKRVILPRSHTQKAVFRRPAERTSWSSASARPAPARPTWPSPWR
jgi:hypothetical protein